MDLFILLNAHLHFTMRRNNTIAAFSKERTAICFAPVLHKKHTGSVHADAACKPIQNV